MPHAARQPQSWLIFDVGQRRNTTMTIIEHIDRIDTLVVQHAKAPGVAHIRNQLSTLREQVEALQANHAALKNELTVLKNVSAHETAQFKEAYGKLEASLLTLEAESK